MSNLHFRKANFGGARAPPETSGMSAEDAAKLGRKLVSLVLQIIFGTRYIYVTYILNDLFTVCAIMNRRVTYQAAGYVCQQSITHSITGSLCMAGAASHISPFIVFAPPPCSSHSRTVRVLQASVFNACVLDVLPSHSPRECFQDRGLSCYSSCSSC